jgi:hypothetical protein
VGKCRDSAWMYGMMKWRMDRERDRYGICFMGEQKDKWPVGVINR